MIPIQEYKAFSPTDYADGLERSQFMNMDIKGLWPHMPRIAGPAFTVQLAAGDNLMLHAAIYEAPPDSILVVDAVDDRFAVAGGNVCAIAQRRGIQGMIIDGAIRDIKEIRDNRFPVFAKGVIPKPGKKEHYHPLKTPVNCGGVTVETNDIIIADEEGIAVVPFKIKDEVYQIAKNRGERDAATALDDWESSHHEKIRKLIKTKTPRESLK